MTNLHLYHQNDLWQKTQNNIQACQSFLTQADQALQTTFKEYLAEKQRLASWLEYWTREAKITELETDAHHCKDSWQRQELFQQMKALIQINQELKKSLQYELN